MQTKTGVSERRACRLVGLSRSTLRYEAVEYAANELLAERIVTLAHQRRRKGVAVAREVLELPRRRNEVWSMDFVMDSLSNGRRIKILTIVDDCTKEAVMNV